jgi:beta-lactamase class A
MLGEKRFIFLVIFLVYASCNVVKKTTSISSDGTKTDIFFTDLFKQYPQYFDSIIPRKKDLNIQVIYTQIDRDQNNFPKLTNYYYNVNPNRYFYPASTVKMPVAALALQRLNELKNRGINRNTTVLTDSAYSGQTMVLNDSTAPAGRPTIGHYIKKIFLVSDNDAFNRLYEFLG